MEYNVKQCFRVCDTCLQLPYKLLSYLLEYIEKYSLCLVRDRRGNVSSANPDSLSRYGGTNAFICPQK